MRSGFDFFILGLFLVQCGPMGGTLVFCFLAPTTQEVLVCILWWSQSQDLAFVAYFGTEEQRLPRA